MAVVSLLPPFLHSLVYHLALLKLCQGQPFLNICDPTARNELHCYSVMIQNAMIFDLQVKNIDFWFSSKLGASGFILFENIAVNRQM